MASAETAASSVTSARRRGIGDMRRERLGHRADMPRIPLHGALGGRMLEVLQRARDEPGDLAQREQDRRREVERHRSAARPR